jgi:hypothetical protein
MNNQKNPATVRTAATIDNSTLMSILYPEKVTIILR